MGKALSFFFWVWLIVVIAANIVQGTNGVVATRLTQDISDTSTTINVSTTTGFPSSGIIQIDGERMAYTKITPTSFTQTDVLGATINPLVRGANDTTASSHSSGAIVRTIEGALMNTSAAYSVAVITDTSGGIWAIPVIAVGIIRALTSFLVLPISFLGTDLAIIGIIWWVALSGMIISTFIRLASGRSVL